MINIAHNFIGFVFYMFIVLFVCFYSLTYVVLHHLRHQNEKCIGTVLDSAGISVSCSVQKYTSLQNDGPTSN